LSAIPIEHISFGDDWQQKLQALRFGKAVKMVLPDYVDVFSDDAPKSFVTIAANLQPQWRSATLLSDPLPLQRVYHAP